MLLLTAVRSLSGAGHESRKTDALGHVSSAHQGSLIRSSRGASALHEQARSIGGRGKEKSALMRI